MRMTKITSTVAWIIATTAISSCHAWMAQQPPHPPASSLFVRQQPSSIRIGASCSHQHQQQQRQQLLRLPLPMNMARTTTPNRPTCFMVSHDLDEATLAATKFLNNGVFDESALTSHGGDFLQQQQQKQHDDDDDLLASLGEPLHETMEYGLRFAGVARLYAKEIEAAQAAAIQENVVTTTPTATTDAVAVLDDNDQLSADESCPIMESDAAQTVLERLSLATVVIVGLGGVGSWAAEALCRSGIGHLVLIDLDDICISNTNRQVHTLSSTVGHMKIDEMKRRLQDVHPYCRFTLIHDFVSSDNVHEILTSIQQQATARMGSCNSLVCLDAMDAVPDKVALISACADLKIPVVTCGGAAELKDPTRIQTGDLAKVMEDSLLKACRKMLRQEKGFERGLPFHLRKKFERAQQKLQGQADDDDKDNDEKPVNGNRGTDDLDEDKIKYRKWNIGAVYSTELPAPTDKKDDASAFRRCDCAAGTACFVTGTFGFVAAGRIVDMIANQRFPVPRRR